MKRNTALAVFAIAALFGLLLIFGAFQILAVSCIGATVPLLGTCLGISVNPNPVIGVIVLGGGALFWVRFGGKRKGASSPGVFILTLLLLGTILLVGLGSLSTTSAAPPTANNSLAVGLVIGALLGIGLVSIHGRRHH